MTDLIWVITSSVLIIAIVAIRAALGKRMSAGLRYALWGLVLIRLLIPGTVFSSPVSVETAAQKTEVVQNLEAVREVSAIARTETGSVVGQLRRPSAETAQQGQTSPVQPMPKTEAPAIPAATQKPQTAEEKVPQTAVILNEATPERFTRMQKTLKLRDVLNIIWYTGMGLAAVYFVAANLRFYLKLRGKRERIEAGIGCPVYKVEGLTSSCLFLNSIYISRETAEDPEKLRYVLAHERAHRRHGDGLFALLRSAAIVLHWYNPLVWFAAILSRRDSEIFADAGAIAAVGDDEREQYGRALIELSTKASVYAPIACAATMMTSGKAELKRRVKNIAKRRRMGFAIAAAVLVLALAAVGCSFLGGEKKPKDQKAEATAAPTEAPTAAPTGEQTEAPEQPVVEIPEEFSAFEEALSIPAKWYSYEELSANPELGEEMTYLKSIADMETVHDSPEGFCITDDGEIAVLDTVGARLCVYDAASGQIKRIVPVGETLDAAPIRAAKSGGVYYILIPDYNTRIVAVRPDGTTSEIPVPQLEEALEYSYVSEFRVEDDKLIITLIGPSSVQTKAISLSNGSVSSSVSTSWTLENGTFTVTKGDMKWSFPAEPSSGTRSSRLDVLKVDELGNLYVVQEVPAEGQDDVGLYQVYDINGRLIHCDRISYFMDSYLNPDQGRFVGPDGNLYEMYCNEDVVKIMRIVASAPYSGPGEPTEAPAADPAITEAAWAIAEKIEEVHGQKFDKDGATVKLSEHFAEVRFPCVTYEEEVLVVMVEKDGEGNYKADAESVYAELAEGARDRLEARFDPDAIGEKQEEFRKAEITVTADEIRARGCEAEIGSDEYKAAAAAVYGEKLAEYYRGSLTEDSPFCCYDVRCVGTETNDNYEDSYNVLIGFRFRDMLLFSYLFDYGPTYEDGMLYPGYEGWLVGWTLVEVVLRDDGSFVTNAWLNSAA